MIYIFNVLISLLCFIPIIIIKKYPKISRNNHFKNHVIIFILKLLFISMFIYIFIHNFNISNYKIFIISGTINFTFFHILEGFVNQKNFTRNENNT